MPTEHELVEALAGRVATEFNTIREELALKMDADKIVFAEEGTVNPASLPAGTYLVEYV